MDSSFLPDARTASRVALAALLAAASGLAQAQWAWHDNNGVTTFSDTPPPADVRPNEIVHQPSPNAPLPPAAVRNEGSSPAPSATPTLVIPPPPPGSGGAVASERNAARPASGPKTLADQDADFRKRMADRDKAEQKQAEDEAQAAQKRAACEQARGYMQMIESGTRLLRPDAEGNRNFLDDDQRAAEAQKTQETIAKNC